MTTTRYRGLASFSRTELNKLLELTRGGYCLHGYCPEGPPVGIGRRLPGTTTAHLCRAHFDEAMGMKVLLVIEEEAE